MDVQTEHLSSKHPDIVDKVFEKVERLDPGLVLAVRHIRSAELLNLVLDASLFRDAALGKVRRLPFLVAETRSLLRFRRSADPSTHIVQEARGPGSHRRAPV
jgi:hypothetical protein